MLKDTLGAFMVGFFIWGEDEEIIHVNDKPFFGNHVSEGIIHESLECCWGVSESEEYDRWFEESLMCDEGGFPLVTIFDVDIVVATSDIKLGE